MSEERARKAAAIKRIMAAQDRLYAGINRIRNRTLKGGK